MGVVGGNEGFGLDLLEDRALAGSLRRVADAVTKHEVGDFLFQRRVQLLAPDQRVLGDTRGTPDDLYVRKGLAGEISIQQLQPVHRGGVVGRRVLQAARDREQIGLMIGRAHVLETGRRIDVAGRKQEGHRGQSARGGLRIAHPEIERLVALQYLVERDAGALLDDDHRLIAVNAGGVHGAGEHLAVCPTNGLQPRLVGEPAQITLLEAHALDQGCIVGAVVGLHRLAQRLGHVLHEGRPVLFGAGLALGRQDREDQLLADRLLAFAATGEREADDQCKGDVTAHSSPMGGSFMATTSRLPRLIPKSTPGALRSKAIA